MSATVWRVKPATVFRAVAANWSQLAGMARQRGERIRGRRATLWCNAGMARQAAAVALCGSRSVLKFAAMLLELGMNSPTSSKSVARVVVAFSNDARASGRAVLDEARDALPAWSQMIVQRTPCTATTSCRRSWFGQANGEDFLRVKNRFSA